MHFRNKILIYKLKQHEKVPWNVLQHFLTYTKTLKKGNGYFEGRESIYIIMISYFLNKPCPKLLWINEWANERIGIFNLSI